MSKKLSIYAGAPIERLLSDRQSERMQPTAILNTIADRYLAIVRRHTPDLTVAEWSLIFDALNGVLLSDHADSLIALYAGIEDAIQLDGLAKKWGVDGPALVSKLRALSYAGCVAVADAAERFWARFGNTAVEISAALSALGINPAEAPEIPPSENDDPDYYAGAYRHD